VTVRFWGVRGSVPSPLSPSAIKAKISSVLQRVTTPDLASPEARERFLAGLPPEIFGSIGGNTTCLEVVAQVPDVVIVDAGTGLVELGRHYESGTREPRHYHIFLTHFHWDHLQGLPFFAGLSNPLATVTFYSTVSGFERFVRDQMREPYFPVTLSIFPAKLEFKELTGEAWTRGDLRVTWKSVNHPGSCTSYRFDCLGKAVVFSTDTELRVADFVRTPENNHYYGGLDALILDAQYTLGESIERSEWGHSSSSMAVDFALEFGARCLYLFHHEPSNSDTRIETLGRVAQWYADNKSPGKLTVRLARENHEEDI